jgi:hypothetical protein
MRLTCALAITLWLSFPAAGMASPQQDTSGSASRDAQAAAPSAMPSAKPAEDQEKDSPAQNAPAEKPRTESAPSDQLPEETSPVTPPSSPPQPPPTKVPESAAKKKTHAASASTVKKHRKRTARAASGVPRKVVIREGGASEPAAQIAPGMPPAEAARERHDAEQWLGTTDDQLKHLAGHTLDARQQETVAQIHNYMDGARTALKEGDVGRASTLAQKAHLLSDDLVKH